jgi:DNA-binding response OmpR family regulator
MRVMRVLVVEDHPDVQRAMVRLLRHFGYEVAGVGTVAAAEAAIFGVALGAAPDLVLLDLMLPDGDGATVLGRMRAEGHPAKVAVLTARSRNLEYVEAMAPDLLMRKPIEFEGQLLPWLHDIAANLAEH